MVVADEVRCASTISASPETVTSEVWVATRNETGRSAAWPTVTRTLCSTTLAKPGASTVTVYCPGGNKTKWYSPSIPLVKVRSKLRASSRAETFASFTTAPLASLTETCSSAVACALHSNGHEMIETRKTPTTSREMRQGIG